MFELDSSRWVLRLLLTLLVVLLIGLVLSLILLMRLKKQQQQRQQEIDDLKKKGDGLKKELFDHKNYENLQDIIDDALGEKDAYKDLIHGRLSQVDAVFFTYLSSMWGGDFTRTERTSSLVHYAVNYNPKVRFKFEVLLRSGYDDVTILCWSLHPKDTGDDKVAAFFEDAAYYATSFHIAIIIGIFYIDQLRLLTLANLYRSRSLDRATDQYFEISDHAQAAGRIRRLYLEKYEEEMKRIEEMLAVWREEAANADPQLIEGISIQGPALSELVEKAEQSFDAIDRTHGRPSDPEYDAIHQQYAQKAIGFAEAKRRIMALGASEAAAGEAMKRRIRKERKQESRERNSES